MIFLFYGENTYAARQKINEMVKRYQKANDGDFGLERFDGDQVDAATLLASLTSVPFLANSRLVIVSGLSQNKQAAEAVLESLDRIPDSTIAVFYEPVIDQRTKLFKELKAKTTAIEFKFLTPAKLINWLRKTAQDLGGELDGKTAQSLIERAGTDQWQLEQELHKLINYQAQITPETIQLIVEPGFQATIFDLIDGLMQGNLAEALELYQNLRKAKAEPLYIVSMIGWQLRNLLVMAAGNDKNTNEIAKAAGISPFVINKSRTLALRLGVEPIKEAYKAVIETDHKLKSTGTDADTLVKILLSEVSSVVMAR